MNQRERGRQIGRKAAVDLGDVPATMQQQFDYQHALFPTLGPVDFADMVLKFDRQRVAAAPDPVKFPETRGLADLELGKREGFREASGLDDAAVAFHFSFQHMILKHVASHHLARYDLLGNRNQCTNVIIPHGKEGFTIADNRDDVPNPGYYEKIPAFRMGPPAKTFRYHPVWGGVSSSVLLDDEPANHFPLSPWEIMPDDCLDDIRAMVQFMQRYADFYGPGNQIWMDRKLNAVAVEKANVKVAFRWPTVNGAVCITACSYLDPQLNAHKKACTKKAAAVKGEKLEDNIDQKFFDGCDKRHHRLWELTNAAAKDGDLWDAFYSVADTKVPFPDRVCLAGEKVDPQREPNANWTLTQHAAVLTGPNRRGLYRSVQDLRPERIRPIYEVTPNLVLGDGVEMKPEWQADIDAGKCRLAPQTN